jgi:hypothetical protein
MSEVTVYGLFCFCIMKMSIWVSGSLTSDNEGQIICDVLISHEQYSIIGNECISTYPMITLPGKVEPLL